MKLFSEYDSKTQKFRAAAEKGIYFAPRVTLQTTLPVGVAQMRSPPGPKPNHFPAWTAPPPAKRQATAVNRISMLQQEMPF